MATSSSTTSAIIRLESSIDPPLHHKDLWPALTAWHIAPREQSQTFCTLVRHFKLVAILGIRGASRPVMFPAKHESTMKILLAKNEDRITAISLRTGKIASWERAHPDPATREEVERVVEADEPAEIPGLPECRALFRVRCETAYVWISKDGDPVINAGLCWGPDGANELWTFLQSLRADFLQKPYAEPLAPLCRWWIAELVRQRGFRMEPERVWRLSAFLRNSFCVLEERAGSR